MSKGTMSGRLCVAISVLLGFAPSRAAADFISSWEASSGLLPTQICPPWTLLDNASPEDPILGSQFLTLSTSANLENVWFNQIDPVVDTSGSFFIEARVRFVSGSFSHPSRAPIAILFTTAPAVGNHLFIRGDEVFFNTGDLQKGPSAFVDTDGAFHTYRIEVSGTGSLALLYDGSPILTGQTFTSESFNGPNERIGWGEASLLATGTSEWAFFKHNALATECAVPEPSSLCLFAVGAVCAVVGCWRCRHSQTRRPIRSLQYTAAQVLEAGTATV